MNASSFSSPEKSNISDKLQVSVDNLRAELLQKRSQRTTEIILTSPEKVSENLPNPVRYTLPSLDHLDFDVGYPRKQVISPEKLPVLLESVEPKVVLSKIPTNTQIVTQPPSRSLSTGPSQPAGSNFLLSKIIIDALAIMHTYESPWEVTQLHQVILLGSTPVQIGFFKKFFSRNTKKHPSHTLEMGDAYELKIPGFQLFHILKIHPTKQESLRRCTIQNKLGPTDSTYILEVLVKFPLQEGGILEIYHDGARGPKLINRWKIDEIFLRRPKVSHDKSPKVKK